MERLSDLANKVRPSIVGVVSPTSRGSGYCALSNGLIVTSLDVVGYEREVQVTLDDGSVIAAVVVRANVALDVALLMPAERILIPHLQPAGEGRIGDSVMTIGRMGGEPMILTGRVVSTGRACEGFPHLQLDMAAEEVFRGAPLLDKHGGVLGLMVRPRRCRSIGDRNAHSWLAGLALPSTAFEGGLMSADGTPEEVMELGPEYGCPRCDTVFEPEMDRCLDCGTLLPHRWLRDVHTHPVKEPPLKGLFAAKAALASLGIPANRARVGPRTWRFSPAIRGQDTQTQVDLTTDAAGDNLILRAPLVRLPNDGFEHFYRHLLTLNDETSGAYRFGAAEGTVYLSLCEPVVSADASTFPSTVSEFSRALDHYRAAFERHFALEPAFDHELDS